MKILVTGGAGFLGSHLAERLLNENCQVIAMDNLLTGRVENIEHLLDKANFFFIKQDVTEYLHVPGELDAVIHLASPASPIDYLQFPIQTLKVGSLGTHKALGLAKEKRARFLLASTSETYGDPQVHPQAENYWGHVNPVGPRGVYDEAKRFAEAMTMAYHRYHGLDTRIVRIFNTYGERMRPNDGRVVSNLIVQAIHNLPMTIYGDGSQTRSFCYVTDLIEGVLRLLRHKDTGPSPDSVEVALQNDIHFPINIGNPSEYSVLELAHQIKDLSRSSSDIEFRPLPTDDPKVRQPDIQRAKRLLDWKPSIPLEEGLMRTISYFTSLSQRREGEGLL